MRITGGSLRGRKIETPTSHSDLLRPSKDIVRESIFNILEDISNYLVLDVYAGTGILGFESLSRGARHVDYVEKMTDFTRVIQKNARNLDLDGKIDIFEEKVELFLQNPHSQKYELIFLDPPYKHDATDEINQLQHFVSPNGFVVYLHSKSLILDNPLPAWNIIDTRTYGKTTVSFLQTSASE